MCLLSKFPEEKMNPRVKEKIIKYKKKYKDVKSLDEVFKSIGKGTTKEKGY